ncbi:N-6 DNA methylase [Tenacibaculum finnmarkense genomovar finnmarkense]|uniref:class I SAM-dependent DNA methyltransferase n=1 Tax=Tenacibaculum finnmarkense TaxID=2781243 RepID=UPI001E4049B9|nr:N-6 DNA methylase [Tenacibaculum finnmarkense]MCD8417834.1 type I restriction-modification system subunit M [Tenacibaculum finnmarkense genomovar finnmarkense]MCG8202987.1 N-6 DNA methylase [Tenacibaculum finnmarkense genomovar finnmarkense]MCG8212887.1 N-6 DNA methylase [Tenacibaculum finnmarkense genomovar finnmarkense]MCG8220420.1 N-6 DNA methylase [Tenacibaculum finnmarkense genomovar finnmarkense]MCG8223134.1 N-6 DNA methylase [Tenacibaculum finnmarkense genomovar finnmarkense]
MALSTQEIVNKLWNLCNVLRDEGITYHQYLNELTFILFLKMAEETEYNDKLPEGYRWEDLIQKEGIELTNFYRKLLLHLGTESTGKIQKIYNNAQTSINEPASLRKIIKNIDELDWFEAKEEGLGEMYEGLLEKNASEKKSGAGQYFTPRPLINVMVRLMNPKVGERLNDPACGTYGFMIAAHHHILKNNDIYTLDDPQNKHLQTEQYSGCELVGDTHRLAMMNAFLHGMGGNIDLNDSLSSYGESIKNIDLVLANPPFGTKKGGDRPTRGDLVYPTSNKQLNFLQGIYRSLHTRGGARAAVVLPDNVLFEDGDGQRVRQDLMDKCNLHTILRLPTGIFYAAGVKTNVLFFDKGTTEKKNTQNVWFYDMRTNMPKFGKRTPFTENHFVDFEKAYNADDRTKIKDDRFSCITRDEITNKNDSLDLGLIADDSITKAEDIGEPIEIAQEALAELKEITKALNSIIKALN